MLARTLVRRLFHLSSAWLLLLTPALAEPTFRGPVETGTVASGDVTEASGLAASRRNPGTLWVVNDSGDRARVFAVATDGRTIATYVLQGAHAVDYEDLAVGPGPSAGLSYLYVGDIGDNLARRGSITVYRVPEPDTTTASGELVLDSVVRIELRYPDRAHDAESLLCDPRSGDLYLITKDVSGENVVFRAPAPGTEPEPIVLENVGIVRFPGKEPSEIVATSGDISSSAASILVRSYERALLWQRGDDQSVAQAIATQPTSVPVPGPPHEAQGEAIAFSTNGDSYFTIGEGVAPPLFRFDLTEPPTGEPPTGELASQEPPTGELASQEK